MSTSRFLASVLAGFAAGILLAPEKGANTRRNLTDTAGKLRDDFNRLTGRSITRLNDLRDYLDRDIEGLPEDVRSRILTILNEAEEMAYSRSSSMSNGMS